MKYTDYEGRIRDALYVRDIAKQYNDKGYIFNHGLNAFCQDSDDNCSLSSVEKNLNKILNDNTMEICCSYTHQHVGAIGIELEGTCLLAATSDLSTKIDKDHDNKRIVFEDMLQYVYEGDLNNIRCDGSYGEAVVTNYNKPAVLWCNPYVVSVPSEAKAILAEAKRIAAKYNLQLKIVMN